jgi:NADPH:quinone reductase
MDRTTLPHAWRDLAGTVADGRAEMIGREIWAAGGDIGFTREQAAARLKPNRLSMVEVASAGINYITAFVGLEETARVQPDEIVWVTGARDRSELPAEAPYSDYHPRAEPPPELM